MKPNIIFSLPIAGSEKFCVAGMFGERSNEIEHHLLVLSQYETHHPEHQRSLDQIEAIKDDTGAMFQSFDTEAECQAYIQGLIDANGWDDYSFLKGSEFETVYGPLLRDPVFEDMDSHRETISPLVAHALGYGMFDDYIVATPDVEQINFLKSVKQVHIYFKTGYIIEFFDGNYHTFIDRSSYTNSDLKEVEKTLWNQFLKNELVMYKILNK